MFRNINGEGATAKVTWPLDFGVALRYIWWSRNENIFRQKDFSATGILRRIRSIVACIDSSWLEHSSLNLIHLDKRSTSIVGWQPPCSVWLKVNCDAAITNHGASASVGGCASSEFGNLVFGFRLLLELVRWLKR